MINRAKLRGKPLDPDCQNAICVKYASRHDGVKELCLGLGVDKSEFRVLLMCRECGAWVRNAKPYKEESDSPEKITIEREDGALSAFYPYPAVLMHSEENPCKVKQGRIGDSIWRQREMRNKIKNQTTLKVQEEAKHED